MTCCELENMITLCALQEVEDAFYKLRQDYRDLREHADVLEALLDNNSIDYPYFCGW